MFAQPKGSSVARRRLQEDTLLSKMLSRVVAECRRSGVEATPEVVESARRVLEMRMQTGQLSDRELRELVKHIAIPRKEAALQPQTRAADLPPLKSATPEPSVTTAPAAPPRSESVLSSKPLLNTTKRERQFMADAEWIKQANEDREFAAVRRLQERQERADQQRKQQSALNGQLDEHNEEKRRERENRRKAQDDMTQAIADAQNEMQRERREAFEKAQREKHFRAMQVQEIERQREQQRQQEHQDQVRQMMLQQQEIQRQRDEENAAKMRERAEWQKVLKENEARLAEKARAKEELRAENRRYQREYEENLDRQERERAEQMARKEARAAKFQQMANVVAQMHSKKVQNVDDKIEAEFQEQQRRAMEDERQRRQRQKSRVMETQQVLRQQQEALKQEREREKEEARRVAEAMKQQAEEAERQEMARKQAAKAEAARMREFLTTQLQLQHYRETKPLETSIARPESRATTMFSPSRYTPSPKPS